MTMQHEAGLEALVVRKTLRVPACDGPPGDGDTAARQFDAVLMSAGFKCSRGLMEHLSALEPGVVIDAAVRVLAVVRELAGDHAQHNAYFRDFPRNVPGTLEFWADCMRRAFPAMAAAGEATALAPLRLGMVGLLGLPGYGTYQHSYEEMLAAHDELIPSAGDRVTVLHLGGHLDAEIRELYLALAGSRVPLSEGDLEALREMAVVCACGPQPAAIPVRENRAVINLARLDGGEPLLADTVTDVLRLAVAASGGDVSLQAPAKFRSFRRPERRTLLGAIHRVAISAPGKLGDVAAHREPWKRLGERLHPHEYPEYAGAAGVFAVARGEKKAPSFAGQAEALFAARRPAAAAGLLPSAPGLLFRSLDRLLRTAETPGDRAAVAKAASAAAGDVSGRVILSVREHLQNRSYRTDVSRMFVNRRGRAWVTGDSRDVLDRALLAELFAILDEETARRLPRWQHVVADPAVLSVALPLSGKTAPGGLGILPRGSVAPVSGELLRFFVYWKQREHRTDYDLSALMLSQDYGDAEHVSWTAYHTGYATYSGDLTHAENGASEFVDIRLPAVTRRLIIPQVHVYAGEAFDEAEEAFFGFMLRDSEQAGAPFEARTVRMKSDLRGAGKVALPLAFARGDDGCWRAKWMHLYLRGRPAFNLVEGHRVTTTLQVRSVLERDYLQVRYLTGLLAENGAAVTSSDEDLPDGPVTYIGLGRPENLPEGSEVFTPANLAGLIPA